jgi:ribosome biogenesis protein MAK21
LETLYDPLKREPKYANAEKTQLYELVALAHHAHPTVRLWAQNLLDDKPFSYKGDPILDFTIANFLDRLAYKDPKSLKKLEKFKTTQRMANTE